MLFLGERDGISVLSFLLIEVLVIQMGLNLSMGLKEIKNIQINTVNSLLTCIWCSLLYHYDKLIFILEAFSLH